MVYFCTVAFVARICWPDPDPLEESDSICPIEVELLSVEISFLRRRDSKACQHFGGTFLSQLEIVAFPTNGTTARKRKCWELRSPIKKFGYLVWAFDLFHKRIYRC